LHEKANIGEVEVPMSVIKVTKTFKNSFDKRSAQADKESSIYDVKDAPLFSVLVVSFQQMHLLGDCLYSILKQDYPNIELVVCDDGSADFDEEEVRTFIERHRTKNIHNVIVYKQPHNVGIVKNDTTAIKLASGVFFKFHGGDDMLYSNNALTKVAREFQRTDANIISARSIACNLDGSLLNFCYPDDSAFQKMENATVQQQFVLAATAAWGVYTSAPAVFWKRAFFYEIGGFDMSYIYLEDITMWLKITAAGHPFTMLNDITTIYRIGGSSNGLGWLNLETTETCNAEVKRTLQEATPVLEKTGGWTKMLRHKHCIQGQEIRTVREKEWTYWTWFQRLIWKVRHLNYSFVSWLYRLRTFGVHMPFKQTLEAMGISVLMFIFHVPLWPTLSGDALWSTIFLIMTICLVGELALTIGFHFLSQCLNQKTQRRR